MFAPLLVDDDNLFQTMASECTDESIAAWQAFHKHVVATMTLVGPHCPVAEYTMEVLGDFVTFSWGDEPMPDYLHGR
jgi:hypothetical protein